MLDPQRCMEPESETLSSVPNSVLLDTIRIAFLVFNNRFELVHANPPAKALIESRDWLWVADNRLKHRGKHLVELDKYINRTAIKKKANDEDRTLILGGYHEEDPLLFCFSAIGCSSKQPISLCAVIDPSAQPDTDMSALREIYSLTNAEASIISLIVCGKDYKEIATERNVTVSTIRSFTKSIFKKLGVGSRAGVIHKVQATSIQLGLLRN